MITIAGGIVLAMAALFALPIALGVLLTMLGAVGEWLSETKFLRNLGIVLGATLSAIPIVAFGMWFQRDWLAATLALVAFAVFGAAMYFASRVIARWIQPRHDDAGAIGVRSPR